MKTSTSTYDIVSCLGSFLVRIRTLLLLLISLPFCGTVLANVIEGIDISRVGDHAQVVIRFATEIQYLRHAPENEAKFLRVFFRVVKPGFQENDIMQEIMRSPPSNLLPRFELTYPELVNGMLIAFEKQVRYSVVPGVDARSIVISIPLPPEKRKDPLVSTSEPKQTTPIGKPSKPQLAVAEAPVPAALATAQADSRPGAEAAQPRQTPDVSKPEVVAVPLEPQQVEDAASVFFIEAVEAVAKGDFPKAINRLNRVQSLPFNKQTQASQALLGEVREKNGEIAKAKAEYELYLKLFPNGDEVARVTSRLALLPKGDGIRRPVVRPVRDGTPAEWTVYGSISSYWFGGQSKQDSGGGRRDQDMLISSINLNARLRDAVSDTRIVFRDTDSRNFLRQHKDYNRLYSAYAERTDREVGYFVRVGRQNPNGSGVLERFDGITSNYNLGSDWKIGAVAGAAVDFPPTREGWFNLAANKKFYGANVEYLPQVGRPGANLYAIEQTLDGYLNRRAVGSEIRYFDGSFNAFGVLDYDVLYKGINIGMVQGNYTDPWGNSYFINYDYRKSPTYALSNALPNTYVLGITTVGGLVNNFGIDQSRQLAIDSTPTMTMFGAGVTVPIREKWQFGFDYRTSKVNGTNATLQLNQVCKSLGFNALDPNDPICIGGPLGDVPISQMCSGTSYEPNNNTCTAAQSSQGRTNSYTAQIIGTNLFVAGGVGVAMATYYSGAGFSGENYGLNYIFPFAEAWRLEGNLRYFLNKSDNGSGQSNFTPSLKLGYQWSNSLFIESEVGFSDQKTTGINASTNKREYLFLGLRWDVR